MTQPLTGSQVLFAAVKTLQAAQVPDAPRDARKLFAHAFGVDPARVTLILPEPVEPADLKQFEELIRRRGRRVPVSHLIGKRAFYGRDFIVTADVLDPRPETEVLVAEALRGEFARVLDLGTGSGCILLSLLAERPEAVGVGADHSRPALEVAARNAAALDVSERARFVKSDWMAQITGQFDLIVSNPPYIAADEMQDLLPEVRDWEPRIALTDEADGLSAYRVIVGQEVAHLLPEGRLMFEIGPTQAAAVKKLLQEAGLQDIAVVADLDGRDRVVHAKRPAFLP